MLSDKEIFNLELTQKKYFIESNRVDASYFQWLLSKGTNFTCYIEYLNSLSEEQLVNGKINAVRTVINAFCRIISFPFFYWTILLFVLHKFNFKKPVTKLILCHLIFR